MHSEARPKLIVIGGPTASGKTSLSVEMALELGGEIVSGDSMQVYRGMDIGTAKPTLQERKGVPHHLLDVVNPDEEFNAALYKSIASQAIQDIHARGKVCLVVGGTGLYIRALLGGLFECPGVEPGMRESLQRQCEHFGTTSLHERLRDLDPKIAARIHPNDGIRITRALEIIQLTGRLPSELSESHGFQHNPFQALKIYLQVDRETLYRRIDERSLVMIRSGLIEETQTLLTQGYATSLKSMQAIGYRHITAYLQGDQSLEQAVRTLQRDTRQYAKRQLTWFRGDPDAHWVSGEDVRSALDLAISFLGESP